MEQPGSLINLECVEGIYLNIFFIYNTLDAIEVQSQVQND